MARTPRPPTVRAAVPPPVLEDEPTEVDLSIRRRRMTIQQAIHAKIVAAFDRSELTVSQLSTRTGLCRRTIERVLGGETCELSTVERIASSLRVRLVDLVLDAEVSDER